MQYYTGNATGSEGLFALTSLRTRLMLDDNFVLTGCANVVVGLATNFADTVLLHCCIAVLVVLQCWCLQNLLYLTVCNNDKLSLVKHTASG